MKAREILGNIVHYKYGHIDKDIIVDLTRLRVFDRFPERFTPVLLTEDWLVKFGFEYDHDSLVLSLFDDWTVLFSSKECGFSHVTLFVGKDGTIDDTIAIGRDLIESIIRIKYVHHLQNLCFALTGEELKIAQSVES